MTTVQDILGGKEVVQNPLGTALDYTSVVEEGLPKQALLELQKHLQITIKQLVKLIGMSDRTLSRYESTDKLPEDVSEAILQLGVILAKGIDVFGDEEVFRKWMDEPNGAMDGKTPASLLGNRFGAQLVLDVLSRIEWGVYS